MHGDLAVPKKSRTFAGVFENGVVCFSLYRQWVLLVRTTATYLVRIRMLLAPPLNGKANHRISRKRN